MTKYYKIYYSKTIINFNHNSLNPNFYFAKINKFFLGESRIKVYITGKWYYLVAYEEKDGYGYINDLLSGGLKKMKGKRVFFHERHLNKSYIKKLNKLNDEEKRLHQLEENKKIPKPKLTRIAMKNLKLKDSSLKNSFYVNVVISTEKKPK